MYAMEAFKYGGDTPLDKGGEGRAYGSCSGDGLCVMNGLVMVSFIFLEARSK